jgi:hypothetical protein
MTVSIPCQNSKIGGELRPYSHNRVFTMVPLGVTVKFQTKLVGMVCHHHCRNEGLCNLSLLFVKVNQVAVRTVKSVIFLQLPAALITVE